MRRSLRTPLTLLGLLLAGAMVCTTSAQAPKPDAPAAGTPDAPTAVAPGSQNAPRYPVRDLVTDVPAPSPQSGHAQPLVVGRYQAVSHDGRLIVIDTATGECFSHADTGWKSFAPPIEPNSVAAPISPTPPAPNLPAPPIQPNSIPAPRFGAPARLVPGGTGGSN